MVRSLLRGEWKGCAIDLCSQSANYAKLMRNSSANDTTSQMEHGIHAQTDFAASRSKAIKGESISWPIWGLLCRLRQLAM
jgi:hypothetical protein